MDKSPSREDYIQHMMSSAKASKQPFFSGGGADLVNFCKYHALFKIITDRKRYPKEMRRAVIQTMEPKHVRCLSKAVSAFVKTDGPAAAPLTIQRKIRKLDTTLKQLRDQENARELLLEEDRRLISNQKGGFAFLLPIIAGAIASTAVGEAASAIKGAVEKRKRK